MKLIETVATVDKYGRITLQTEMLDAAGLKPGDEVQVTLTVRQEESENLCPQLVISPNDRKTTAQMSGYHENDVDLTLPNTLLEAAEIPEGSDLEIICTAGAIVIMEAEILDNLPDELREFFEELGFDPGTVREVMREEGYFV
ncbi:hypothetical protein UNSWDHB_835 [Dehalobacter sp. UNSWDHB]|uniref:hypothetical protein n=1 Tax=Dehalobacter sp. UNSWDHB TaxID=1339256 RepID=UPI0003878218|nr:hypothetical protein [Dehalobacter sp. UNSWDHB]EQB21832.1 hypothetical protein UNSWDHB_835 [Dehalobacter sp. UNSWDHB]